MRRGAVGKDEDMEAYSSFAEVYDIFQDNVPYEEWCSYVTGLLREQGVERGLVLDLGEEREVTLEGDLWQLDARLLGWKGLDEAHKEIVDGIANYKG